MKIPGRLRSGFSHSGPERGIHPLAEVRWQEPLRVAPVCITG